MPMSHSLLTLLPAIFLMGPTASGKTDIAIRLAQEYPIKKIAGGNVNKEWLMDMYHHKK